VILIAGAKKSARRGGCFEVVVLFIEHKVLWRSRNDRGTGMRPLGEFIRLDLSY
jgi:hypothetical protein